MVEYCSAVLTRTKSSLQGLMKRTGQGKGWGRVWMPEEDELLIKAYRDNASLTPLRNRLGRSVFSIRWRAEYLNLRGTHARSKGFRLGPDWSEADEARLRRDYGKIPTPELARQMGRTRAAIFTRANILGLAHEGRQRWTSDHLAALRIAHEHGISLTDLAAALGREVDALHKYAAKQGLAFGRRPRRPAPPTLADILNLPEAAKGEGEGEGEGKDFPRQQEMQHVPQNSADCRAERQRRHQARPLARRNLVLA